MLSKCGLDWQTQQREVVAGRFKGTRSLAAGWVQLLETGVLQKGCILPSTTFLSDLICWSHRHLCLRPEGVNRQLKAGGQASKREGSSSSENPGPREEMRGLPMGGTSTPGSGRMSRWARAGEGDTADGGSSMCEGKEWVKSPARSGMRGEGRNSISDKSSYCFQSPWYVMLT